MTELQRIRENREQDGITGIKSESGTGRNYKEKERHRNRTEIQILRENQEQDGITEIKSESGTGRNYRE